MTCVLPLPFEDIMPSELRQGARIYGSAAQRKAFDAGGEGEANDLVEDFGWKIKETHLQ